MSKQLGYNTNLAAEYHVLSMLYRKGFDAHLTLGNKKSVDIVLECKGGTLVTIDVKGLRGTTSWRMGTPHSLSRKNHYYALVSFKNEIENHNVPPECWVIPANRAKNFLHFNKKGGYFIQRRRLMARGKKYEENWKQMK